MLAAAAASLPLPLGVLRPDDNAVPPGDNAAGTTAAPPAAAAAAARAARLLRRACRASNCCTLNASSTLFLHSGHVQLRLSQEPMQSCKVGAWHVAKVGQ